MPFIFTLGSFGYWGMFTQSGNHHHEEMAGIVPFFSLVIAGLLFFNCGGNFYPDYLGSAEKHLL